jgi:iron complex transport system permease protein
MFEQKEATIIKGQKHLINLKNTFMIPLLLGLLLAIFVASLFLGRYMIDPVTVIQILVAGIFECIGNAILSVTGVKFTLFWSIQHTWPSVMDTVVWSVRFPRAIAVVLVGAGLAISGAVFQGTFRNPLVSESILGVSSGAGVGAAIGILLSQTGFTIELFAFAFGLLAVFMTYWLSRMYKSNPTLILVLAGIIVSSLFSAVISLIKYVADPYTKLPDITFWLMGSFAKVSANDVLMVAPVMLICMSILLLIRWRLNVLSMGDEEARALGIDTKKLRLVVILCATLTTSAAVCISGLVGWVGLVIPQMARMVVGPDHRVMLPATVLMGASYLLIVDTICRDLTSAEIPISIVTAIVGAPLFMYLLKKVKESWS